MYTIKLVIFTVTCNVPVLYILIPLLSFYEVSDYACFFRFKLLLFYDTLRFTVVITSIMVKLVSDPFIDYTIKYV